jgi:acylphosphatase
MDDLIHWKIEVKGTVQGVGYRARCLEAANELGLVGSVRNDPHAPSVVLIEVQGTKPKVSQFLHAISGRRGLSDAKSVQVVGEISVNPELSEFSSR